MFTIIYNYSKVLAQSPQKNTHPPHIIRISKRSLFKNNLHNKKRSVEFTADPKNIYLFKPIYISISIPS